MSTKEQFTADEWEHLVRLPIHVFALVSGVDNEIQMEEIEELIRQLEAAPSVKDPLHRALLYDLNQGDKAMQVIDEVIATADGYKAYSNELESTRAILQARLTGEEYNRFFASLRASGTLIGESAGKRRKRLSRSEKLVLFGLMATFDVDLDAGNQALTEL